MKTDEAMPIHVLFLVISAGVGGAEMQVISLLNNLDPARIRLSLGLLKDERDLLSRIVPGRISGEVFCCDVSRKIDMSAIRQLANFICKERVDIIVCTNLYPLFYAWLARRLSRCSPRLIEVFHSTALATLKEKIQMWLYRPFFKVCDAVVYVCANQRAYWRSKAVTTRKELVIHNGVDVNHFTDRYSSSEVNQLRSSFGFEQSDYVVGLCAFMRPEKAHVDLLNAMLLAGRAGVHIKCLFIGDGPERRSLEKWITTMGLSDSVTITGLLADVRPAVAACDALVIASHCIETFSISALESMAMGKAMIMTDVGGATEQITHGENGFLYEKGNIESLRDLLMRLSDRSLSRKMGESARRRVMANFSVGSMTGAYEKLFFELVQVPTKPLGR